MQANALISAVGFHGKEDWTDLETHLYVWGITVPETSGPGNDFHCFCRENNPTVVLVCLIGSACRNYVRVGDIIVKWTPLNFPVNYLIFQNLRWVEFESCVNSQFWFGSQSKPNSSTGKGARGLVYDGFMSYVSYGILPSHYKNLKLSTEIFLDLFCVSEDHPHTVVSPSESQPAFWFTQWVRDSVLATARLESNTCKLTR